LCPVFLRDVINGDAESRSKYFTYLFTTLGIGVLGDKGISKIGNLGTKVGKFGEITAKVEGLSPYLGTVTAGPIPYNVMNRLEDQIQLAARKAFGDGTKGIVKPVSNMNEFFDMEFGKSISNSLSKSKVKYDGQSIYKVEKKTDNQYLKKGYGVYLDALHKDHLEVIDKTGNVKYVLNLDGTLNPDKTKKALGRVVKGWK
ncbi:cytosolic protein, partial [Heyndrickxia sporothermodurans]